MVREVTERDFRMPEYRDAKPEDYEFRADGKMVRKDRWEQGIHRIANVLVMYGHIPSSREFEIDDIVAAIQKLAIVPEEE